MRAREFIVEGRQRIDEYAKKQNLTEQQTQQLNEIVNAIAGIGLAAWQVADTSISYYDYLTGKKTEEEFWDDLKTDAAYIVAGAAAGGLLGALGSKLLRKAPKIYKGVGNFLKKPTKPGIKPNAAAIKKAADAAKKKADAISDANRAGKRGILAKGGQKVKDFFKKSKPAPKTVGGTLGKTAKTVGGTLGKTGSKFSKRGALAGALGAKAATSDILDKFDKAGEYGSALKDYFGKAMDYEPGAPKKTGKLVYTGSEKNPPVKDFDPGGLGLDYEKTQAPKPKTIDTKTMKKPANPFKALTKQALAKTDLDDKTKKSIAKQVVKQKSDEK